MEGPDGDLWVGTNVGLRRISSNTLNQLSSSPTVYHTGSGLSDAVAALQFAPSGALWIGTRKGLFRLDHGTVSTVIPDLSIFRIERASSGHLLIVTERGFVEWDGASLVEHPDLPRQLGVAADKIYYVFEDHTGARWFCTGAGLARQVGSSIQWFPPYDPHASHEAFRAFEDPQGNVWVALATGLFRATASALEPIALDITVRALSADRDGNLWVGTNGQGLIRFKDRLVRMFTSADGLPNNLTMAALVASNGKLWVGNNCGGLSWFDGNRFQTYSEKDGLKNSCVLSLAEDLNKDLWVGTFNGGLFRLHDGHFTGFSKPEGLLSDVISGLFPASDGSLWVCTDKGVTHLREGHTRNYTMADGLSGRLAMNGFQDHLGNIWVGTNHGINRLDSKLDRFVSLPGEPDVAFQLLGQDESGHLYTNAGPKGIFRIEGDRLLSVGAELLEVHGMLRFGPDAWFVGESLSRTSADYLPHWKHEPDVHDNFSQFDSADGLTSRQFSDFHPNVAMTPDGKLWVPTALGLAMLDTPKLPRSDRKPSLYIEQVTVGRTVQSPGSNLVVPAGARHVELRFDAIELRSPEKIHFQYRMDGVDREWLEGNAASTAVYTGFAIGTHQFHVRACNRDGVWDRAGIVYDITQLPFFYETNVFRFTMAAGVLLLIAGLYRLRLRQMAVQMNAELNARVEERTRMARELHDTLLQTIQVSKMVAEHTLAGYRDDQEDPRTGALQKLSGWLTQALQEARASLQSLRLSVSETNNLAEALRAAAAEYGADHPIQFSFSVKGTVKEMHPIVRDDIYHVGYEAIRNACKHSGGSHIEVQLEYTNNLLLRVCDDGRGIDAVTAAEGKPGHFGLKGMYERSARIGGKLILSSSPGSGTMIELTVPGRVIFSDARPFWRTLFTPRSRP